MPNLVVVAAESVKQRLLNGTHAALYLDMSKSKLSQLRLEGKIPYVKVGASVYHLVEDLDAFIKEHRVSPDERAQKNSSIACKINGKVSSSQK